MNGTIDLLLSRRTIRRFKNDQLAENELNAIIDAGLHAPNAGGAPKYKPRKDGRIIRV